MKGKDGQSLEKLFKRKFDLIEKLAVELQLNAVNVEKLEKMQNMSLNKYGIVKYDAFEDMGGESMYRLNLKGPIGLVIGNEGEGVGRLVKEKCDFVASIPMKGEIDSLNASVAAGVLAYEIVRQRTM